ncbi:pentatricopeptide repeat-containing protein, mitochondrial-like protein [Cinnamomum micranthum f. kanehirae]|uniref:Pentatricopeptide repeat-containing protein, mitochondrial-like protein n=1 Tax=Cinnamomum micranthum f. kanehirae TaxID=337451 RepID=A0A3S3MB02_9MAGN|nr:pentatricopeptide repeat-containing protein, mitochondrial-like protein [Cinnamomum micranthum f. kanehirae]
MAGSAPSYALEVRDAGSGAGEKEEFSDSKCAFLMVALCPCFVILIIVLIVVSIFLMVFFSRIGGLEQISGLSYNILSGKGERTPSEIDSVGFSIDRDGEGRITHLDPRVGEGRTFSRASCGDVVVTDAIDNCDEINNQERLRSSDLAERPVGLYSRLSNGVGEYMQVMSSRDFSNVANRSSETEDDSDECGGVCKDDDECTESADPKEVERVCKVIEDLFASERNMEAVLNQCDIDLSHALVLAVLSRFRYAWKPSFRFFSWVKNLLQAGKVWNELVDKGLKPDIVAHNTMLEGLLRGKRRSEAIKLFELMKSKGPSPNVRSYTIFIRDLCRGNKMEEAIGCFDEMLAAGCKPDAAVYTCLIVGFGNQKKMDIVFGLLKEMKAKGCPLTPALTMR